MKSYYLMLEAAAGPAYYLVLTLGIVVGSLALISPKMFQGLCEKGSYWVKTPLQISTLDRKVIDTDSFVLQNCRLVGAGILCLVLAFAAVAASVG